MIWCTTNVERSSSRATSSTPSTTVLPGDDDVSEAMALRIKSRVSSRADSAHEDSAPNGIDRAEDVPTIHRTSQPCDPKELSASRAIRLLPTPAAPQTTIPAESEPKIAASMSRCSLERPVNGHVNRTHTECLTRRFRGSRVG